MKRIVALLIVALAMLQVAAATYTVKSVPDVHRLDRERFVSNPDGILPASAVTRIDTRLKELRRATGCEAMVVAVDNIEPEDINTFATDLFEYWGLGKDDVDNGLLVLIVKDQRLVTIRPGYGLEGVLPDITCGRIIREIMAPAFAEGDYGAGTVAAVDVISDILSDPANAAEYISHRPDADEAGDSGDRAFSYYLIACAALALFMLLLLCLRIMSMKNRSDYDKYRALESWKAVYLALTFMGLGMPAIASIPLLLLLNKWRNHRRNCPNCGTAMIKVDEVNDNRYLTPSQDLEEQIGSVDYDVWLCPSCGETDILAYVNKSSPMIECENCHARTARLKVNRIVQKPTAHAEGKGVQEYECLNCHHTTRRYYKIPRDESAALAALGVAAMMAGGRRGGGFG
ncbi:MAG: TPM domain-containing protein, partial [Muribaculaceae bacterium]|nr:TPM domain-containing protein [Muribaculaceae bacterium]